ncbi:N-6 DNA methylase [Arthrobacter rhombi]|uniref:class I SAM-dependent DNA methyltransferase n=1 Tax=Arthrobacter rhombi TaxID=71253 RepID=UPI0031CE8077
MPTNLLDLVEAHQYQDLFLKHLRWSKPDLNPLSIDVDGQTHTATNVSTYRGLRVWVTPQLPNSAAQAAVDRAIAKQSVDRIVIFHNDTKQVWRWPSRTAKGGSTTTRLTSHTHVAGRDNPKLLDRLNLIALKPGENLGATEIIERVKQAFDVETERETKRASKLMAAMYDALEKVDTPEHDISVTLARILFLMFGDDTGMWDKDVFQDFILDHTRPDGSNLAEHLTELFAYLDHKPAKGARIPAHLQGFKYVNGGIFKEKITLAPVGKNLRAAILDACSTDWSGISPAIFGSMFQSVRDAEVRREFGEHYTSERDILRTLNPLFLDELRTEFTDGAADTTNARRRLRELRNRLGRIKFLDPACGCGNFIILAYRELRLLEIAIVEKLRELGTGVPAITNGQLSVALREARPAREPDNVDRIDDPTPVVELDHFYGIEIDEWPAKIAETAMFLMERQCDLQLEARLAYTPQRLPIAHQATIITKTAENASNGNALRFGWETLFEADNDTVVAGNPPYVGPSLRTDDQTVDLQLAWGRDYDGYLDYVTGWHAKTMSFLEPAPGARFAFVTTNSISQGQPVPALFGPLFQNGWRIRFAHRTFPWESEASGKAAVHCVIVGFDKSDSTPQLWDYNEGRGPIIHHEVTFINAYLVDGPNVLVRKRTKPITSSLPEVTYGSKPVDGGHLVVKKESYDEVGADPIAAKYLRSFIGADELIGGKERWCLWLTDATEMDLQNSPVLRERIAKVRTMRLKSSKIPTQKQASTPHLFTEIRQPKDSYLCIPSHFTENRLYATVQRFDVEVIASNANFTALDPDGFLFSLISSSMFLVWQRMVGGRIKSDYRFSNTIVWNNFPLGNTVPEARNSIVEAGKGVLAVRANHPGTALEDLYDSNRMPKDLLDAHRVLDKRVEHYFGVKENARELDRQRLLLERYAEHVKA